MRFLKPIWIFLIVSLGLITVSESTIEALHSSPMTAFVGDTLEFRWKSDKNILFVNWGVRSGSAVDPQYIFVDNSEVPAINAALDDSLKRRLFYVGNMAAGLAWFNITNANVSDSKTYVAKIREQGSTAQPYYVQVIVDVPTAAPPTTVTTTPDPTNKNISTTLTPTTPTTPTPATSKNYKVMLNGTCNITKDVQQYIKNQTTEVFSVLSDFYNVTVAVKKLSSVRFIINLNLWFNKTVNESTIETYVGILLDRINNTMSCHFSSTITAISPTSATPTSAPIPRPIVTCTTGVKVGCAIGLLIAVVIIVVIVVVIYRKKKEKKDWATWEKALVVVGFIVAIVIIIVIIVIFVNKCT